MRPTDAGGDADVLVVLACVRLRGLAPASVEQRASRRHAGGRWGRPLSRKRLSACGWPARSVPAPKSEYLL
jgi:hypothetical protein